MSQKKSFSEDNTSAKFITTALYQDVRQYAA